MKTQTTLKICFKDGIFRYFDVSDKDAEKFLAALEIVTAEEFILNGIAIDPKEIESIWIQVFPVKNG